MTDQARGCEIEGCTGRLKARKMCDKHLTRFYECMRGHSLTGDNLYLHPVTKKRQCRICMRARLRSSRKNRKAIAEAYQGIKDILDKIYAPGKNDARRTES